MMLKHLTSRNQRSKEIKVKIALRTCLVLGVGVWMIYQLSLFLNQKLSSEDDASGKGEIQQEQLELGRKGLLLTDGEARKPDGKEESIAEVEEIRKSKQKNEMEEEKVEQIEDLVDGAEKGGDGDDEELETERFDDPMEEIETLNDDYDDGVDETDENATAQQQSKGEEGSSSQRLNKDETG